MTNDQLKHSVLDMCVSTFVVWLPASIGIQMALDHVTRYPLDWLAVAVIIFSISWCLGHLLGAAWDIQHAVYEPRLEV